MIKDYFITVGDVTIAGMATSIRRESALPRFFNSHAGWELLAELIARLDRRMFLQLSVMERYLYFTLDGDAPDGSVVRHSLVPAA